MKSSLGLKLAHMSTPIESAGENVDPERPMCLFPPLPKTAIAGLNPRLEIHKRHTENSHC